VNAWIGRRSRRADTIERHGRALAALRDLAEHPQPMPTEPPPPPTDHVRILDERPTGVPTARRRTRRAVTSRRTATARARPRDLDTRPVTAHLPTRPASRPAMHFDDVAPAETPAPAVPAAPSDSPAPSVPFAGQPRVKVPARAGSARALAITGLAVITVVLIGTVTAVAISNSISKPKPAAAPKHHPAPAPPATVKKTTTTVPRPPVQLTANATGDGVVTVPTPFTLTLTTPSAPCWISVQDAQGRTVFTGTLQPGQQQLVPGTGPLLVRLGNSPAVQISVNGAPLNMAGIGKTANVQFAPAT
jgi:cytoskeletal protein RodZ